MNDVLAERIRRQLDTMPDEQAYQVLDYIEFLESKYGAGERHDSVMDKVTDRVQDTLRAARLPAAAIRGTMGAMDSAARLMDRLAGAGRAAAAELGRTLAPPEEKDPPPPPT